MFQLQPMARKRGRDDYYSDSDSDLDEDRCTKKSRPRLDGSTIYGHIQYSSPSNLPYRSSHIPSPPGLVTDIEGTTPVQSEYGGAYSPVSIHDGQAFQSSQSSYVDYSMEMDDDDADIRSQPPESPALGTFGSLFMRPAMLNSSLFGSESANSSGRIPTPMHSTFKRGGMNGLGFSKNGFVSESVEENEYASVPSMQTPLSRKINRQEMIEDRSRRMPSPISEDDDLPDTPTALTQSQLSRLSFSHANTDQMETDLTTASLPAPPTPRGRKRSGAFTGMGRFSMGYREDCEKCRQRVPGHYSHFLP